MNKLQLARRLYTLSIIGLIEANTKNPFIDRAEALAAVNRSRALLNRARTEHEQNKARATSNRAAIAAIAA
jgi:hypothetical protein